MLLFICPLVAALPRVMLGLLLGGGLIYPAGTLPHTSRRLRFQNASWHATVLVATLPHLAGITLLLART